MIPTVSAGNRDLFEAIRRQGRPDRAAILAPGRKPMSFAQLHGQVERFSGFLAGRGFRRGDAIAVAMPDGPEQLAALLAVSRVAACAPVNPAFRETEFEYCLRDLGAQALLVPEGPEPRAVDVARRLRIEVITLGADPRDPAGTLRIRAHEAGVHSPEPGYDADVALLLHTSATTGTPKLVPLAHEQLLQMVELVRAGFTVDADSRLLLLAPMFHLQGLINTLIHLCNGASVVSTPGFRPERFQEWMQDFQPTTYTANPTLHRAILSAVPEEDDARVFQSLQFVTSIGAPLTLETHRELVRRLRVPVHDGYGLTEAGRVTLTMADPERQREGSVGLVVGPEAAVQDASGRFLEPGAEGEIVLRGPTVMRGYAHNPEANAAAFRDGWFRTGDLGRLEPDGHLFITGRIKEMINRGAEKVLPYEVEAVLRRHPMVEDVAVFGYPHPRLGEDVAAAVVARAGFAAGAEELRAFAGEFLADFKVPRSILFLDAIPKGRTGKYQRARLAELLGLAAPSAQAPAAGRTPAAAQVERIWCELLKVPAVADGDDFFAIGGDSLLALTMVVQVEKALGCKLDPETKAGSFRFARFVEAVQSTGPAPAPLAPGMHALRREGAGVPLFFLHGVYTFQHLVPLLAGHNPVFALEPPDEAALMRAQGFDCLVEDCLDAIRRTRPHGPYLLAGHSMGGLVAYETSRRLLASGEAVAGVVLLDTLPAGYRPWPWMPRFVMDAQRLAHRFKLQLKALLKRSPADWPGYLAQRARAVTHRSLYRAGQRKVLRDFRLRHLAVPTLLLCCRDEDRAGTRRMVRHWRSLVGPGLRVQFVEGDHETVLRPPLIERVAEPLRGFLAEVDGAG